MLTHSPGRGAVPSPRPYSRTSADIPIRGEGQGEGRHRNPNSEIVPNRLVAIRETRAVLPHQARLTLTRAASSAVGTIDNSPYFSHRLVARRRRVAWMQGARSFGDEGIVATMLRSRSCAQRSRRAAIRLRSRDDVRNAGQPRTQGSRGRKTNASLLHANPGGRAACLRCRRNRANELPHAA